MIIRKSDHQIRLMEQACRVVAEVLVQLADVVRPGVKTIDLDRLAEQIIAGHGAKPAFKGYRGFPATLCTSVNDEVVHGIPGDRLLKEGDIVGIDVGAIHKGYYGDAARTYRVGSVEEETERLLTVTEAALRDGIAECVQGKRLGDISAAVQSCVEAAGFSVVRDFVGHGIGRNMHEEPQIPNYGRADTGPRLRPGMTLALEPMVNAGGYQVRVLSDGWTAVTTDGGLSAHFEHTVLVTEGDPRVLTAL